jgi:hypothetical protein
LVFGKSFSRQFALFTGDNDFVPASTAFFRLDTICPVRPANFSAETHFTGSKAVIPPGTPVNSGKSALPTGKSL